MQYDRSGTVVCEGEWVCDAPIVDRVVRVPESTDLLPPLHSLLVSLRTDTSSCGEEDSLLLHPFPRLKSFLQQTERGVGLFVCGLSRIEDRCVWRFGGDAAFQQDDRHG